MEESGGNEGFKEGLEEEEVSLLAEEIINLSMKSAAITPGDKPMLICTVWTKKSFNPDSFRAQMKSIWKTKDDLELILKGQPWLFRKQLIIFDKLIRTTERSSIKLKPLRRGIFVSIEEQERVWIPFKYEKLPTFCFGCGRISHAFPSCEEVKPENRDKIRDDPSFSLALKAENSLIGKESLKLNAFSKKKKNQCSYTGKIEETREIEVQEGVFCDKRQNSDVESVGLGRQLTIQEEDRCAAEEDHERNDEQEGSISSDRKARWRRTNFARERGLYNEERIERKRKLFELGVGDYEEDHWPEDTAKRMKHKLQDIGGCQEASRPDAMKIICWNVRGLGNPRAVKRLRFLLKQNNPDMVFLMETKIDVKRMEGIRRKCGFVSRIDIGAEG
ncbi:reverse transcriptase [Gossypium australe]|uniref:Reverse transcriptase n=1 Tax=Gossypium australe TaxID=47621 RepID=A0A5B6UFS8_9ROSI|nr:reverse transcriptase [Gossypium australe]